MQISAYTFPELKHFEDMCNLTKEENELFWLRSKAITLEECAERMNVSVSTAKRISQRVIAKIKRIM